MKRMRFLILLAFGFCFPTNGETIILDAEAFTEIHAERRSFGGVGGVFFNDKKGFIQTRFETDKGRFEVWARVYFPWHGQDNMMLKIGDSELPVSARNENNGGRWDIGNFQVWHWVKAGAVELKAAQHTIKVEPAGKSGHRIGRVVLYGGSGPAWSQPWLGGAGLPSSSIQWRGTSLKIPADEFQESPSLHKSGGKWIALLNRGNDRLRAYFKTSRPRKATLWARVFFEAKNMFEGLTMEEMASNLYLSIDGELRKTVFQQNGRQWHWISSDRPIELGKGMHQLTIEKLGDAVRIEQIVFYNGENPHEESWFQSTPPPIFPFEFGAGPEQGRAGNWRAYGKGPVKMEFQGETDGAVRFPVSVELPEQKGAVDLLRVTGHLYPTWKADATPHQQVGIWMKNGVGALNVDVLYQDRNKEYFLQRLSRNDKWEGWKYLAAPLPFHVKNQGNFADLTGYANDGVRIPALALGEPAVDGILRVTGGDGNRVPDFPLAVKAIRVGKEKGPCSLTLGEPGFDSPFRLRVHLASQTKTDAGEEVQIEIKVSNEGPERIGKVFFKIGRLGEPSHKNEIWQQRDVRVAGNGTESIPVSPRPLSPGIYWFEARSGRGKGVRRLFAAGESWQQKLPTYLKELERKAGAFRCSKDGADRPLLRSDGKALKQEDVTEEYGKGISVKVDGIDVCSTEYAWKHGFANPIHPRGSDLSDEAGWPFIDVPNGVLAIDPKSGRLKFSEGRHQKISFHGTQQTGFGVPGPTITVRGNLAYVGPGEGHYSIVDCQDRARPRVLSQIGSWYFSYKLFLFRNFGFFESSRRGLVLVDDLSNPHSPGALRRVRFDRGRYGRMVKLFEEDAVAVFGNGKELSLFDISTPLYPRLVGQVEGAGSFALLEGTRALVRINAELRFLDLARPDKPKLLPGAIPLKKDDKGKLITSLLAASADWIAVRNGKQIDILKLFAGKALTSRPAGTIEIPKGCGRRLFGTFHQDLFYLIDGKHGPGQYSLSATSPKSRWFVFALDEGKAEQVSLYEHPWPSAFGNITIADNTAYVSDYNYGMWLFDLKEPSQPTRVGGAVTAGESDALWIDGDHAYQWQTFGGAVFLIDIKEPAQPQRRGEYWDGAWLPYGNSRRGNRTIAGKDGFIYVPRQRKGLVVVDARDASQPKEIGLFKDAADKPILARGSCIDVWGDRAYVIHGKSLLVYDVKNAAKPKLAGTVEVGGTDTLCAGGNVVYVGNKQGTLSLVDVSKPSAPVLKATLDLKPYCPGKMQETISGMAVGKGIAYLTARGARSGSKAMYLHIVDARDLNRPRWLSTYDPYPMLPEAPCSLWGDFYQDLFVDGDYLFIGNYGQIECFDISEPESPKLFDVFHAGYQWSVGRKRFDHLFVPALSGMLVLNAPSSSQVPKGSVETYIGREK